MRRQTAKDDRRKLCEELLETFGDKAYSFAMQLSGDEQLARDLVQNAFLKAFDRLDDYDSSRPFFTWFASLLHNIYVDSLRKIEHRSVVSMDSEEDDVPAILARLPEPGRPAIEHMLDLESDTAIQQAIRLLDRDMRTVVALCDIEGYSYEEASAVMSCPVGTVRSRLARARAKLREFMTPYVEAGEVVHAA